MKNDIRSHEIPICWFVDGWHHAIPGRSPFRGSPKGPACGKSTDLAMRWENIGQNIWFVVEPPLWKIWLRQLGWLETHYMEHKHVPNHQPKMIFTPKFDLFPAMSTFNHSCESWGIVGNVLLFFFSGTGEEKDTTALEIPGWQSWRNSCPACHNCLNCWCCLGGTRLCWRDSKNWRATPFWDKTMFMFMIHAEICWTMLNPQFRA